jgi:hypothetical protein
LLGLGLSSVDGALLSPEKSKSDDIAYFFRGSGYVRHHPSQQRPGWASTHEGQLARERL